VRPPTHSALASRIRISSNPDHVQPPGVPSEQDALVLRGERAATWARAPLDSTAPLTCRSKTHSTLLWRSCAAPERPTGRGGWSGVARTVCCFLRAKVVGCARTNRRTRDESQWIVATRPLCHLQYPVRYLSRLQRIYLPQYAELRCAMVLGLRLSVPSHIGGGRDRRVLAGILT